MFTSAPCLRRAIKMLQELSLMDRITQLQNEIQNVRSFSISLADTETRILPLAVDHNVQFNRIPILSFKFRPSGLSDSNHETAQS
jgi:hypothetical protein